MKILIFLKYFGFDFIDFLVDFFEMFWNWKDGCEKFLRIKIGIEMIIEIKIEVTSKIDKKNSGF